jgi:hypothetical protein
LSEWEDEIASARDLIRARQWSDAESHLVRAEIIASGFDDDDPRRRETAERLANLCDRLGDTERAERFFKQVVNFDKLYGRDKDETQSTLALTAHYDKRGQHAKASNILSSALESEEALVPIERRGYSPIVERLAQRHHDAGEFEKAREYYQLLLLRTARDSSEIFLRAGIRLSLASIAIAEQEALPVERRDLAKLDEPEEWLRERVSYFSKPGSKDILELVETYEWYARLNRLRGNDAEADRMESQARELGSQWVADPGRLRPLPP